MSETLNTAEANEEMVTVARFMDPSEAQLAKSAVEAAGVAVFLQGENANSLVPMAFRARLLVAARDEAAAREVLDQAGDATLPGESESVL